MLFQSRIGVVEPTKEKKKILEFKRKLKSKFLYLYFLLSSVSFLVQFKEPLSCFLNGKYALLFFSFFLLQLVFTHSQAQCPSSYLPKTQRRDLMQMLERTSVCVKWKNHSDFPSEVYSRSLGVTVARSSAFLTDDTAPSRVRSVSRSTPSARSKEKKAKIVIGKTWRRRHSV